MNVIIGNKYRELFGSLQIDVIKSLNGEYAVDDILSQFTNFFFGRMILDITSIKDYKDVKNIQKIALNLDADKIILFLDPQDLTVNSPAYLSQLVSMGIYNFTSNIDGVNYLLEHPNSYKDVANLQQIQGVSETPVNTISSGVGIRVIGIKNLSDHAGATTLTYMLKKELAKRLKVIAIEVGKKDFMYFNDRDMVSVSKEEINNAILKYKDCQVILIDLNDQDESICNDILYLLEPSIIKLNKLLRKDFKVFERLKGKRIILNNSTLSSNDIANFEGEARTKIFFNIPPQNERSNDLPVIVGLLVRLGILRNNEPKSKGLFKF